MAWTLPAAVALAVAVTGTSFPAVAAAPAAPATDPGRNWSLSLSGVSRDALASSPSLTHRHDDDGDSGSVDGQLAALSRATPTDDFTLAAVSWEPDADDLVTSVAVRVRENGTWSEWFELGTVDNGDPAARVGSEPVLAPHGDGVQARVETASGGVPEGLRIDLVQPGAAPAAAAKAPAATPAATGDELRPAIVTRAQWGADESVVRDASRSTSLKAMYVHHTVNSNTYTAAEAPALMRSILRYHAVTLGWPDIGYQFLVDRFGTIYEGRRGSLTELVVGAQAGGYNTNTIGVSGIGRYDQSVHPSQEMVNAIVDVLAWQAHKWNLDPSGTVSLQTGSSTGSGTRWKAGEWTDQQPVIRGHRDTNITACPGTHLYDLLPSIREAVATKWADGIAQFGGAPVPMRAPAKVATPKEKTPILLTKAVTLRWKAVPGAASYDVVVRKAKHGKNPSPSGSGWSVLASTTKLAHLVTIPQAEAWTVGVRAVSPAGKLGPVAVYDTISRPVPTGSLVRTTGKKAWTKVRKGNYYRDIAWTTRAKGAKLSVTKGKNVRAVWIIAPSGPGYGRVDVFVGAKKIKTVKLAQSKYQPLKRIKVSLPKPMSGTFKVKTVDSGKLVRVSAIVLQR